MDDDQNSSEAKVSVETGRGNEPSVRMANEKARNYLNIITLIRSIQRAEGNPDCFLRGSATCTQIDCAWRSYCLGREMNGANEEVTQREENGQE